MTEFFRNRRMISCLVLLVILASSSLACTSFDFLLATPTPTSTPTASPTLTPTLTPTATITPTRTIAPTVSYLDWPVVFSDPFDDEYGGWYTGTESDEFVSSVVSITDGKYNIRMTAKKPVFWRLKPDLGYLDDFYATVEMQKISGADTSDFGLVFRNMDGYYYFGINAPSRRYTLLAFIDEEWLTFTQFKRALEIDPTGINRLSVLAQGSTFTVFINDEEVETFEDDELDRGSVGIGLGLLKAGNTLNLEVDNFEVTAPKELR